MLRTERKGKEVRVYYPRPFQTRRPRPCPRAGLGTPPRTAPGTPPSGATFRSRTPSRPLLPEPNQRRPRGEQQRRTGPAIGHTR